jgi:hypothetical protein
MDDKKLWKVFSQFIRLRDSNDHGYCKCFTCGRVRYWTDLDCGHGIGRQHLSVKYSEKNNHAQCKHCNGFEEGMKDIYAKNVDEKYGKGTWNLLKLAARKPFSLSNFEITALTVHYKKEVEKLKKQKELIRA